MSSQPRAPDALPQYLVEGVPKQDDADLRALGDWIEKLLAHRQAITAEEIDGSEGDSIEAVGQTSEGTVVIKTVTCGKDGCRCQSGDRHGPYKYTVRRRGSGLQWEYHGPVES